MTPSRSLRRRLAVAAALTAPAALVAVALSGPAGAAPGPQAGRTLSTTLTGAEETPRAGDPDGTGTGTVTVNYGQRTLCFTLDVAGIDPASAAHLHEAVAGSAGPVVQGLTPPTDGSSDGCIRDVRESLLKDLLTEPEAYYLNVHNGAFPGGALRGQLGD